MNLLPNLNAIHHSHFRDAESKPVRDPTAARCAGKFERRSACELQRHFTIHRPTACDKRLDFASSSVFASSTELRPANWTFANANHDQHQFQRTFEPSRQSLFELSAFQPSQLRWKRESRNCATCPSSKPCCTAGSSRIQARFYSSRSRIRHRRRMV